MVGYWWCWREQRFNQPLKAGVRSILHPWSFQSRSKQWKNGATVLDKPIPCKTLSKIVQPWLQMCLPSKIMMFNHANANTMRNYGLTMQITYFTDPRNGASMQNSVQKEIQVAWCSIASCCLESYNLHLSKLPHRNPVKFHPDSSVVAICPVQVAHAPKLRDMSETSTSMMHRRCHPK